MTSVRTSLARMGNPGMINAMTKDPEHYSPISFFRAVARTVPHFITMYRLEELTTQRELTGVIAGMFRSNATVKDQRAVDLLVIKGQEELHLITAMHKQRHHLITEYVHAPRTAAAAAEEARKSPMSPFLQAFYKNN